MTDERFAEITRTLSFTMFVDDDYDEPTRCGDGTWRMSQSDHQDLLIRLAAANAITAAEEMLRRG